MIGPVGCDRRPEPRDRGRVRCTDRPPGVGVAARRPRRWQGLAGMSGRPTAEIVANLRAIADHPFDVIPRDTSVECQEAADRLAEQEATIAKWEGYFTRCDAARVEVIAQRDALLALRLPCLTCGGRRYVMRQHSAIDRTDPCPENGGNCDGYLSIADSLELLAALIKRQPDAVEEVVGHLRSVRAEVTP